MKKNNPKVSIVIPVYNGSNYLKQAIDSALDQTYDNIEVIVVNDGSNDNGATEEIARSFGNKIKYFHKKNGGVATALNLGIKKMTGEYFSWLSHDDLYYQDKIEKQINFLAKHNFKKIFLYSNYSILQDQQITPVVHNHEMLLRKPKYSLLRGCVNGITVLIPKSVLDEMGDFNEELRCTQDYDYWRKIQDKYEFIHMEDVLSITRLHSAQDSVVSPRVIAESDDLWIDMIKKLPNEEKLEYEGTLFNFYFEMVKFIESTPYVGTLKYAKSELSKLENEIKGTIFNPKVSVIIPFYNRIEATIAAAKSVLSQSYQNTEIILVDDGSTDDLYKLEKFINKNKKIKMVALKTNSGPAAARNLGIRSSDGEYIAFLDSDDTFLPEKLKKQLDGMLRHNLNVSYTSYMKHEGDQETLKCDPGLTGIVVPRIISNCTIATPTAIVRRQLLVDHELSFDESMRVGEDTRFWLEIAKFSEIFLIEDPLTVVNVDKNTHAQDSSKLVVGIKNLIMYLLNDDYYSNYSHDISILCNYFYEISSKIREEERHRLLNDGPVVSVQPVVEEVKQPQKRNVKARIKGSIPYRASRKAYHYSVLVPARAAKSKIGGKNSEVQSPH